MTVDTEHEGTAGALAVAFRRHLRDVAPDTDRLVAVATSQGVRIRRNQRIRTYAGALACAGGIAAAAFTLAATIGPTAGGQAPVGGADSIPEAARAASVEPNPSLAVSCAPSERLKSTAHGDVRGQLTNVNSGVPSTGPVAGELRAIDCSSVQEPVAQTAPVALDLPGWTCGPAADDKMECLADGATALVTWRPATDHDEWTSDPDKEAPYVSAVHGDLFVTIDVARGTAQGIATTVGEALTWLN